MRVEVRRRGGFAGIAMTGAADTSELEPAAASAAEAAVQDLLAAHAAAGPPNPDGFQYDLSSDGNSVTLNESDITDALRPLIDRAMAGASLG
jgi:hypothetical protein